MGDALVSLLERVMPLVKEDMPRIEPGCAGGACCVAMTSSQSKSFLLARARPSD